MTDTRDCTSLPQGPSTLVLKGLGWLGGLSLLTSGIGLAQTAPDAGQIPSAMDLLGADVQANPAPQPVVPTPMAAPEVASPEPAAPSEPVTLQDLDATPSAVGNFESPYIDPTDYSLGATDRPTIIFSERSSGCERVAQQGEMPGACGGAGGIQADGRQTVAIGPVTLGPNGIQINTSNPVVQSFLNLTPRPSALPNNGNTRLMFPLSIPAPITSMFGLRVHPIFGTVRFHAGTDIGAPMGTPVLAVYSGRVAVADFLQGYGLTVILQHDNGELQTLYGHLSELFVRSGDRVEQGEVVGRVGSTGNSTGPHLHFEVRQREGNRWVAVNPGGLLEQAIANFGSTPQLIASAEPQLMLSNKDLSKASEAAGTATSVLGKAKPSTASR